MIRKVLSHSSIFGRGSSIQEYEPLENHPGESSQSYFNSITNCDHNQDEALRSKMQNQLGFCNGSNFRVVSVGDASVMEVMGNKIFTNPRTEDPDKINLQIFSCTAIDSGYYQINSHYQKSESIKMVWDFFPHRGALIQKKQTTSGRGNQKWISETVPANEAAYFILKAPEGTHCLKNTGPGNQIAVVEKTAEAIANPMTHWRLESIQPRL